MLRFGYKKVAKEDFYGAKKPIKSWDVDDDYLKIRCKRNKYLVRYLDEVIRPLVLTLYKMSGDAKTFEDKGEDKNKNNKFVFAYRW